MQIVLPGVNFPGVMLLAEAYTPMAQYYDKLYAKKDYAGEAARIRDIVRQRLPGQDLTLLDVACGTGLHLEHLKKDFQAQGLDICAELLDLAQRRNPGLRFHLADMAAFDLGERFEVVTCLFSAIGYVRTYDKLCAACRCLAKHLQPGGLLLVEPWFTPETWHGHTVHGLYIDEPELKLARINTSLTKGRLSVLDFHYLIGTPAGTVHCAELHELGLFTQAEMRAAMEQAGLAVEYDAEGLTGRGLYLGMLGK